MEFPEFQIDPTNPKPTRKAKDPIQSTPEKPTPTANMGESIGDGLWWLVATLLHIVGFINLFMIPAKSVDPRFKDEFAQGASANAAELHTTLLLAFGCLITGTLIKMYVVQCQSHRERA
jgi:hypothetical protein